MTHDMAIHADEPAHDEQAREQARRDATNQLNELSARLRAMMTVHGVRQEHGIVYAGDVDAVRARIERDPTYLRRVDGIGRSVLNVAIDAEKPDVVRALLEAGADVNIGSSRYTPLQFALKKDSLEVVELILAAGPDVNLVYEGSAAKTPVMYAIHNGRPDYLRALLAHGSTTVSNNSVDIATYAAIFSLPCLELLLAHGVFLRAEHTLICLLIGGGTEGIRYVLRNCMGEVHQTVRADMLENLAKAATETHRHNAAALFREALGATAEPEAAPTAPAGPDAGPAAAVPPDVTSSSSGGSSSESEFESSSSECGFD